MNERASECMCICFASLVHVLVITVISYDMDIANVLCKARICFYKIIIFFKPSIILNIILLTIAASKLMQVLYIESSLYIEIKFEFTN